MVPGLQLLISTDSISCTARQQPTQLQQRAMLVTLRNHCAYVRHSDVSKQFSASVPLLLTTYNTPQEQLGLAYPSCSQTAVSECMQDGCLE